MATSTLAQYLALHDQLVALVKAGVPVHLGVPSRGSGAMAALERIGATVARRIGEGATVQQALEDRSVPAAYRSVAQLALVGGNLPAAIGGASRMAQAEEQSWHAVRAALRYPLVVCALAYIGLVLFCLFLVPTLENTYASMQIERGPGLALASELRSTLPYWVAVPPAALVLLVLALRISGHTSGTGQATRALAWLPGMSHVVRKQRLARFAETLAGHLEAGSSLPRGLESAAATWESDALAHETRGLAATLARGQAARDESRFAASLPPLLRWAIWHADETVGRPWALRMAAGAYRRSAERRVQRLRVMAPVVACLVIGGGVALAYALAVFLPVVQMLQGIAR
jgi:type II secretory pathway component PulF